MVNHTQKPARGGPAFYADPNRKQTHPDRTLVDAARAAGTTVLALWATRGPKGTFIDWMVGYQIANQLVIVQTYKDGDGWNAFVASPSIDTSKTIADVFERCGVQVPAAHRKRPNENVVDGA